MVISVLYKFKMFPEINDLAYDLILFSTYVARHRKEMTAIPLFCSSALQFEQWVVYAFFRKNHHESVIKWCN